MRIHEYYYNENNRELYVEFSTLEDRDNFYRTLTLEFEDIQYYSPDIVTARDMKKFKSDYVIEILEQYLKENDLPEEQTL